MIEAETAKDDIMVVTELSRETGKSFFLDSLRVG
jgi:hypothetical protein